ncbi:MAG: CocE/NonD family hydrolase [Planctomycetota bacterium]|nr:MAG: CocE/NonD family hydrolase [Planctomycetota bacterium]REJ87725.1 MAG: CocE/NonD family hydrolase [Planctomycetota bacterium]REK27808.1 MAG: CocE/NonD family hydrolase [Planctomycetota bacterium]REK40262.1 MAG: CocE/NonD family hydrolase [Planctomycetota bacterium]
MKTVSTFPHAVREIEHTWITLSDGVRLAARIWMPEDAETRPVPAVLEYLPYRKRDFTAQRDALNHPYFAGHGYASVRVDMRGSGDSDGVLTDEYLEQELADGEEVIGWLTQQPWCDGNVGMMGISWGGFNGLQIAARRPPGLKAVITLCSTDDRYTDDVHYMGGCLLGDNLSWASTMFAYNSLPPDPELVGQRWREMWLERLEGSGVWVHTWLQHQRRDAYWEHGSVCEDFSAINCPVMAVSGWADGYSNAVFRLLENLRVPRLGFIGPWSHKYPHIGVPGPAIGFLQEAVAWWDRWLKGINNNIMDGPMLRVWMQDSVPPTTRYQTRPGRWVAEATWPSPDIKPETFQLGRNQIVPALQEAAEIPLTIQSPLSVGLFAGKWCSYAATPDLPHDQRQEDGGALVFDSPPLNEPLEILGTVVVELELSSNRPLGMVAIRLSDVADDDKATRVTYGLLNLTHRNGHATPEPLEPGRRYRVRVPLNGVAQAFPRGHRLRVAISTSYWPLAWAPPVPVRLTIYSGASQLVLPVREPRSADANLPPFPEALSAPPLATTLIEPAQHNWLVIRDLENDVSTLRVIKDEGVRRLNAIDLQIKNKAEERYSFRGDDFESCRGETLFLRGLKRGDWQIETRGRTVMSCTSTHFQVRAELDAFEGDKRVFSRNWDQTIPRDHI